MAYSHKLIAMDCMSHAFSLRQACDPKCHLARSRRQSDSAFVLLDGVLAREWILPDRRRQIVGLQVPGDVCGLTALHERGADHSLVALSRVTFVSVSRQLLSEFTQESTTLSQAVSRELAREAAISAAWIVNLGQRPAYQRIAHLMCELEARLRAAGQDTSAGLQWPGNQADIGAATGLSLVHVNKTLRQLETGSHVTSGRHLKFKDMTGLAAIAGFDPSYLSTDSEPLSRMLLSRIGAHASGSSESDFDEPFSMDRAMEAPRSYS